jgi:hypothetical protein
MASDESEKIKAEIDEAVPIGRIVACIVLFGLWSVIISALHALFPLRVDVVSVIVGEIAVTPVLIFLFRNLEFGFGNGNWKVGLAPNRVQRAFEKLDSLEERLTSPDSAIHSRDAQHILEAQIYPQTYSARGPESTSTQLESADDDFVFIRLRREIERRLKKVAASYGIPEYQKRSAAQLLNILKERATIGDAEARGIADLIAAGNAQAHGSQVGAGIAELARVDGDRLLAALDHLAQFPEQTIITEIANLATWAGKAVHVAEAVEVGSAVYFADALIPNELVIEVMRTPRPDRIGNAAMQLLNLVKSLGDVGGLLVFGSKPTSISALTNSPLLRDFRIGLAWRENETYDGDQTARLVAPWLFAKAQ